MQRGADVIRLENQTSAPCLPLSSHGVWVLQAGLHWDRSMVFVGNHAVTLARFASAPSFGPVIVVAIWCFAIYHCVDARLSYMLCVFAGHGDKGVTGIALLFGDLQGLYQVVRFLSVRQRVVVGPVNFEHALLSGQPLLHETGLAHGGV